MGENKSRETNLGDLLHQVVQRRLNSTAQVVQLHQDILEPVTEASVYNTLSQASVTTPRRRGGALEGFDQVPFCGRDLLQDHVAVLPNHVDPVQILGVEIVVARHVLRGELAEWKLHIRRSLEEIALKPHQALQHELHGDAESEAGMLGDPFRHGALQKLLDLVHLLLVEGGEEAVGQFPGNPVSGAHGQLLPTAGDFNVAGRGGSHGHEELLVRLGGSGGIGAGETCDAGQLLDEVLEAEYVW